MELMITQKTGEISYDFEAAKRKIESRLEEFKGAVFTEESKPYAKKIVAELRKEKSGFSDGVKAAKIDYMKPFQEFEKQAKELISLYDEPINLINGQVQEFEEKRKQEKREAIERIAEEELSAVSEYVSLESVYNKKWENATYKEKDIREELKQIASNTFAAITTIKSMNSPDEAEAIDVYKRTFDITKAISLINDRAAVRADAIRREEERKKREEEERIRREEREKIEAEIRHKKELEEAERKKAEEVAAAAEEARAEVVESFIPSFDGESNLYEYRVFLTADAKEKLEMFMDSTGIDWELI